MLNIDVRERFDIPNEYKGMIYGCPQRISGLHKLQTLENTEIKDNHE